MLGGLRRAAVGSTALTLLAGAVAFLTVGPLAGAPAHAAPTPCVVNSFLNVSLDSGYPDQIANGTWSDVDDPTVTRTRYGLYWPATDPGAPGNAVQQQGYGGEPVQSGDAFQWRLRATCANSAGFLDTSGHAVGFCGRSVAIGSGTLNGQPVTVKWDSTGTAVTLTDPSLSGTLQAQYDPPGNSSTANCVNGTEVRIPVTGVLAAGS
jgi:hypothetical protein